jgi:hypothetical protein
MHHEFFQTNSTLVQSNATQTGAAEDEAASGRSSVIKGTTRHALHQKSPNPSRFATSMQPQKTSMNSARTDQTGAKAQRHAFYTT